MSKQELINALDQVKKSVLYTEKHTFNPFKKLIYRAIFHVLCVFSTHIDFSIYQEKEPLYYVKLPEIGYMRFGFCIPVTENIEEAKKYTEQEIKAIDERYWAFAVKVEEA